MPSKKSIEVCTWVGPDKMVGLDAPVGISIVHPHWNRGMYESDIMPFDTMQEAKDWAKKWARDRGVTIHFHAVTS